MAGKSTNSFGAKNWSPGPPSTRYNVSGKNREFYTFENAPGVGSYATGGTIIDGGDGYIYHIFTGDGTFAVNRPPAAIDSVDYLIAGGGGGIPGTAGAGAGGLLVGNILVSNSPGSYSVIVGGGGAPSSNGSPSSAFGITAAGGGRGAAPSVSAPVSGSPGGSGGGGFTGPPGISASGGTGNIPATIPRQGYTGGSSGAPVFSTGGGGGAGGVGGFPSVPGPGKIIPQFPAPIVGQGIRAENRSSWISALGPNGFCKGSPHAAGIGTVNSGYGAFSGIVCVRYKKTIGYSRATGGTIEPNTHPEHPGVWRHIFTSPGNFTITDPTLQWVDYFAVGGGGGGGDINPALAGGGGGGGAGGFVTSIETSTTTPTSIPEAYPWNPGYSVRVGEQMPVSVGTYPIGIGTGGNASTSGSNTTIGSAGATQIIAYGGGGGAQMPGAGTAGGSSGGNASTVNQPRGAVAASPSPGIQGNPSGATSSSPTIRNSSGGGGAGAVGSAGLIPPVAPYPGAAGGAGWYSVLSPSAYGTPGPVAGYRYFAGGGGSGGSFFVGPPTAVAAPGGAGGVGGGGAGGAPPSSPAPTAATPGTTNTGGGGGGAGSSAGTGGSGIVIIQYPE